MSDQSIDCPCKNIECERYKKCDECRLSHHNRGYLPACERPIDENGEFVMPVVGNYLVTQVAIVVRDIETTKKKFAAFFGVKPPDTIPPRDYNITQTVYMGQPAPKAGSKLAFFNAGPNVQIELIEPNGEKSTWQDFLDLNGEGIHHIAFGVTNMDEKVAACEEFGMICTQRGKYGSGNGEYAYLDATADLKCFIELLESY